MIWRSLVPVSLALLTMVGCRTPEAGNQSDTLSTPDRVPDAPGDTLPDDTATTESATCGRDGNDPVCADGKICVQAKDATTPGRCYADPDQGLRPAGSTTLKKLAVRPANGGINPTYQGISITANVYVASNPCLAKGKTPEFKTETKTVGESRVTHVWPITKKTGATNEVCATVFKPVFKKVTRQIPGLLAARDRVIVHGISDQSENVAKLVYGSACPVAACAQPPQGCGYGRPEPSLLNEMGCPALPCGLMICGNGDDTPAADCPAGQQSVDIGRDPETGCPRSPVCVDGSTCPQLSPPAPGFCSDGTIVSRGPDERGCYRAPACRTLDTPCPQLSLPPPNWCSDGEIVPGGVDDNGCSRAPRCIRPGACG